MDRSSCFVIFVLDTGKVGVDENGDCDNNGLTCSAMLHALYILTAAKFEPWALCVEYKTALRRLWEFNL
jgi:hypothetical protein